ncbi:MAG: transcriptional regulator, TetR family [Ilumatobacteraceae bacterium]|nr:transcriptional regulator, TetR family [Ilumatobacteraceae bacterium]
MRYGPWIEHSIRDARAGRRPRRQQLLQIAAELFAERGFAGVTVDHIGAAAGVSGPALYHHFDSKEALLGEMLVDISERLLERARATVDTAADPAEALDRLIAHHVEFAIDNVALITVHFRDLVHASEADRARVRRLQGRYVEEWVDVLARGRAEPVDRPLLRAAVHASLGLLNSTPFSTRVGRDQMAELLSGMVHRALAEGRI